MNFPGEAARSLNSLDFTLRFGSGNPLPLNYGFRRLFMDTLALPPNILVDGMYGLNVRFVIIKIYTFLRSVLYKTGPLTLSSTFQNAEVQSSAFF